MVGLRLLTQKFRHGRPVPCSTLSNTGRKPPSPITTNRAAGLALLHHVHGTDQIVTALVFNEATHIDNELWVFLRDRQAGSKGAKIHTGVLHTQLGFRKAGANSLLANVVGDTKEYRSALPQTPAVGKVWQFEKDGRAVRCRASTPPRPADEE